VNAAFLLVTTTWIAAADPAPAPAHPVPAPVAVTSSCGGDCNAGCCDSGCDEGCGHRLLGRLRGLFHRDCDCGDSCGCNSAPCGDCGGCGGHKLFGGLHHGCGCDTCDSCGDSCGCGGGLLSRLRAKFHHGCDDGCGDCGGCGGGCGCGGTYGGAYGGAPAMAPAPGTQPEQLKAKPAPLNDRKPLPSAEGGEKPRASLNIETETKSPFELSRRYESRVGHATDYSRLTGQLFFVHADGGLWVLRYAPLSQEDPNGGSVVLARDVHMDDYHEGDLVTVQGELLSQRSSVFLGGPLYHARSIELVDRSDR
jgi:hypothetical protein